MASERTTYLECPPNTTRNGGISLRSRSSGSSTSSLSSTFSDLTFSTFVSSSSPPNSKTNAFFASPFSTRPPSPFHHKSPSPPSSPPRSRTYDFFSTPVRPPSPPASSLKKTNASQAQELTSRIFPSRHTAIPDRSPDYNFLNFDRVDETSNFNSHHRAPSTGSESSFTSSFPDARLPTPPPSTAPQPSRTPNREDTMRPEAFQNDLHDEPTPRPADAEPPLLRFERSLLLEPQAKSKPKPNPLLLIEPVEDTGFSEEEEGELQPGSIISLPSPDFASSHLSLSPLSMTFTVASPTPLTNPPPSGDDRQTPTPTPSNDFPSPPASSIPLVNPLVFPPSTLGKEILSPTHQIQEPKLRLLRCLGHGAFSAVWLAEDLSRIPLTLVSKKSVRNLRHRASGRERERDYERNRSDRSEKEIPVVPDISQSVIVDAPPSASSESKNGPDAPVRRPPSRLREGLKNMLSFSRSSSVNGTSNTNSQPNPPVDAEIEAEDTSLSRQSSIKSLPSNASDGSSLSRRSSFASSIAPSRTSSLRLAAQNGLSLSRDSSLKKFRDRVKGTRPAFRLGRAYLDERHGEMGEPRDSGDFDKMRGLSMGVEAADGVGLTASLSRQSSLSSSNSSTRLVAVKMTPRKAHGMKEKEREEEERTRVGFVREVEVLKHISHPNITPLLAHLSTPNHHILVLPYLTGGDLLGLVNNDVSWSMLSESVLRRIWCELCKAVGWMHGVGLVHRDIKLENILLTTATFSTLTPTSTPPTPGSLPTPPAPFIKLTDFGLSRFVEIDGNGDAELLSTRCGSEAYAAPELVMGGNGYDARKTDAWACGVVLYALVGRQLPFGEGVDIVGNTGGNGRGGGRGSRIGGERGIGAAATYKDRKRWLMRIAAGEWTWPNGDSSESESVTGPIGGTEEAMALTEELVGARLIKSRGAKRIVSRLLVRDPKKRARIGDLWDDVWMQGGEDSEWWWRTNKLNPEDFHGPDTTPTPEMFVDGPNFNESNHMRWSASPYSVTEELREENEDAYDEDDDVIMSFYGEPSQPSAITFEDDGDLDDEEEEEEEDGCLLDQEGIDSITRQEVV